MSDDKQKTDLQASYNAMVEAFEEFVVKEGKTLQQAFHAAEEQLADATEHSREKINQASQELKYNLHLFSDALEGVSHAYKENLLFDWDYINSTLWEKFQSIANSNTTELIAFTKTLKEQAEAATTDSHISAHQQHSEWDSEHAFWLDEIKLWDKNHKEALSKLHEIEQAIKSHSAILNDHSKAIKKHMKLEHQHEQINHAQQAKLHERLKAKHLQTMVMVNMPHSETHKK